MFSSEEKKKKEKKKEKKGRRRRRRENDVNGTMYLIIVFSYSLELGWATCLCKTVLEEINEENVGTAVFRHFSRVCGQNFIVPLNGEPL